MLNRISRIAEFDQGVDAGAGVTWDAGLDIEVDAASAQNGSNGKSSQRRKKKNGKKKRKNRRKKKR